MAKWTWTTETIRMDASDTGRVFDRLIREMGSPTEINRISAETTLEAMQVAFSMGRDPGSGASWPSLSANTIAAKGHSVPLVRTGRLRDSLHKGRPGNVFLVSATRAKVGSRLKHASYAQHGTRRHPITARRKPLLVFMTAGGLRSALSVDHPGTPPRPIAGVIPSTLGQISKRIAKYLDELQIKAGAR